VRADDDVDLAGGECGEDLRCCSRLRAEPRDRLDAHRVAGEPLAERVQVLFGEDGGRVRGRRPGGRPATALNAARIAISVLP
jgi:hypothetical protein